MRTIFTIAIYILLALGIVTLDSKLSDHYTKLDKRCDAIQQEIDDIRKQVTTMISDAELYQSLDISQPSGMLNDCEITYYCCEQYPHICNAGPPYRTATGVTPTVGLTCAVDPRVIPLGSEVTVLFTDGTYDTYIAQDTGGAINGNRIDIVVGSHAEALQRGRDKAVRVYWREAT